MKKIKVDKVILYYMDRVDPDGNLYRFYVYKDMASEIEYFCTEETGNMTIPIGEGKYIESALIIVLRIACFGKHLKNWIWMLVMPHGFTSPAAATTASTIWGSTYAIVDQNIR